MKNELHMLAVIAARCLTICLFALGMRCHAEGLANDYDDHGHSEHTTDDHGNAPEQHHAGHEGHSHDEQHQNGHPDHGHQGPVEFDFLQRYESHARGESEEHGHAGHTSIDGYPFLHGIRTEIDFIERALEFGLASSKGIDDELEFEAELVWAINDRIIVILGAPLIALDPMIEPDSTGIGDLEFGIQMAAFTGKRDLVFFALNMAVPTGDADRDLGSGNVALAPTAMWLHDFGCGYYTQSRFSWEMPVSTIVDGGEFKYDIGLCHTYMPSKYWTMFQYFTTVVEANGVTKLNGTNHGETIVDLTVGCRWIVREMDEIGVGWSFPVTGTENFENQMLLSYRLHF